MFLIAPRQGGAQGVGPDLYPPEGNSLDEIVVTGTHIRGAAPVGSPLVVYSRSDIEETGSATLDQFARNVMGNAASVDTIANPASNIRFSPGILSNGANTFQGASFNLHGLGPTTTLTLLNGQRLAPGGLDGSFTDISQIPLSAVDHIEVLADGASAIYGADAVAGVVNIITRKDFSGAQSTVRYGGSTEGGADEVTASQLIGDSWGTGNALLTGEWDDQQGLGAAQEKLCAGSGRTLFAPAGKPASELSLSVVARNGDRTPRCRPTCCTAIGALPIRAPSRAPRIPSCKAT